MIETLYQTVAPPEDQTFDYYELDQVDRPRFIFNRSSNAFRENWNNTSVTALQAPLLRPIPQRPVSPAKSIYELVK